MNFFTTLNSLSWFRPALFAATGLATLVKAVTPPHTIANKLADGFLTYVAMPAAAGSLGGSNSGQKPATPAK